MAIEVPRRPGEREPAPRESPLQGPGRPPHVPPPDRPPVPSASGAAAQWFADLRRVTPWPWVTPLLIAANIAVFVYQVSKGMNPMAGLQTQRELLEWGANYAPNTLGLGEHWRLATSMFLHGGGFHLAMNMFVLYQIGPFVERVYGNVAFLVVYMLAGITGSLASAFFGGELPSVGASGAVFGMFGALLAYLLVQWRTVPRAVLMSLRSSAVSFIVLNVMIGLMIPFIDNAAHLGGLAGGFVFALALARPVQRERRKGQLLRSLVVGAAGVAAVLAMIRFAAPDRDFSGFGRGEDPIEEIERAVRGER